MREKDGRRIFLAKVTGLNTSGLKLSKREVKVLNEIVDTIFPQSWSERKPAELLRMRFGLSSGGDMMTYEKLRNHYGVTIAAIGYDIKNLLVRLQSDPKYHRMFCAIVNHEKVEEKDNAMLLCYLLRKTELERELREIDDILAQVSIKKLACLKRKAANIDYSLSSLSISLRAAAFLRNAHIETMSELLKCRSKLATYPNSSRRCIEEINHALSELGF